MFQSMSKGTPKRRKFKIKKRRKRREKIKKLRNLYLKAKTEKQKQDVFEKAKKVSIFITKEKFLSPLEKKEIKEKE